MAGDCKRETGKWRLDWDEGRIAVKPGNAGGVKALTVLARERANICYT
jgi:hypothetical protein